MSYDLAKLPIESLLRPISDAGSALTRLDERIARSPVGEGFVERAHFADACASLWIDGELVHLEDLVLHDATRDIRTPTHELTIARDVLRTRRRIAAQQPGWALSADSVRSLRGQAATVASDGTAASSKDEPAADDPVAGEQADEVEDGVSLPDVDYAAIDALLARSDAAIEEAKKRDRASGRDKDPLLYDLDWDEDERMEEWQAAVRQAKNLPPMLQAVVALDAWNELAVLQHGPLARQTAGRLDPAAGRHHIWSTPRCDEPRLENCRRRSPPAS